MNLTRDDRDDRDDDRSGPGDPAGWDESADRDEPVGWSEVRRELDALPQEVQPPRDLWGGIQARIEAGAEARVSPRRGPTPRRRSGRHGFEPPRAIGWRSGLAGVLTMAAAAAVVFFWSNGVPTSLPTPSSDGPVADAPATRAPASQAEAAPIFVAEASRIEDAYGPAIQELQLLLASRDLAPETRAVLDENLGVIEEAIRESREAVAADPGASTALTGLRNLYDAKVQLLRTAALYH